jgi:leucyl/phenylalanyl-tRNA--protein transferase
MARDRGGPPWETVEPEVLIRAYAAGVFPMAGDASGLIELYEADPRGVMPLSDAEGLHVPRSVERAMRSGRFVITADAAFETVVRGCAPPRAGDGVWISAQMIRAMVAMHSAGMAHSVEAWREDPATGERVVVGGIYGVSVGRVFCAESMYCAPRPRLADGSRDPLDGTDASKVCLVVLIRHLAACGYRVMDIQMVTPHTARFGAREISRRAYLSRIRREVGAPDAWQPLAV